MDELVRPPVRPGSAQVQIAVHKGGHDVFGADQGAVHEIVEDETVVGFFRQLVQPGQIHLGIEDVGTGVCALKVVAIGPGLRGARARARQEQGEGQNGGKAFGHERLLERPPDRGRFAP